MLSLAIGLLILTPALAGFIFSDGIIEFRKAGDTYGVKVGVTGAVLFVLIGWTAAGACYAISIQ